jgi:predicted nucleotidyltransferase
MTTRALKSKASDISRIARSHGVSRVRVFGSHAAGRAKRTSDVDVVTDIVLDYNEESQVVGIEILRVKSRVPLANLKQMQFEVA